MMIVVNGNLEEIDESWNHYNHNQVTSSIIKNTIKNLNTLDTTTAQISKLI